MVLVAATCIAGTKSDGHKKTYQGHAACSNTSHCGTGGTVRRVARQHVPTHLAYLACKVRIHNGTCRRNVYGGGGRSLEPSGPYLPELFPDSVALCC